MKSIKFSKTGMVILSAGVFVVVLAGLGLVRSGQAKQQTKLNTDLATSELRLNKVDTSNQQVQLNELNQQLEDDKQQLEDIKGKLVQKIASVDVSEKYFEIAKFYSVNVSVMGTTTLSHGTYDGVTCNVISLSGSVSGNLKDVIDFIVGLNNNYATGFVETVSLTIDQEKEVPTGAASVNVVVYSYEGS
jgi:hypothetical protein